MKAVRDYLISFLSAASLVGFVVLLNTVIGSGR